MLNSLKKHVLFTEHNSIQQICKPLQTLNVVGFIFIRRFQNGTFIDLSNQLEWSHFFLNNYYQNKYSKEAITDHLMLTENISLWSLNPDNIIWQEGEKYFNFGNGISIHYSKKNYDDLFCFYSYKSNYTINRFYLSHIDIFKKFSEHFLDKAGAIIKKGEKNTLHTPLHYLTNNHAQSEPKSHTNNLNQFLTQIDPNYPHLQQLMINRLSAREEECIRHALLGLSSKEIACKLHKSQRTIETHLQNAKTKLGSKNLAHLVSIYLQYYKKIDN